MKIHDTSDLTHRKHYKTWKFTSFLPMESRPFTTGPGQIVPLSQPGPFRPRLGPTGGADRKYGGAHVIGLGQQLRIPGKREEVGQGTHGSHHPPVFS
jgi:hypothetical protein